MQKRKAASEMLLEYSLEKKRRMVEPKPTLLTEGWEIMNLSENSYRVIERPPVITSAIIDVEKLTENSSLADIFTKFLTKSLLQKIWDDLPEDQLIYGNGKQLFNGNLNFESIYKHFAIHIRIIGTQEAPKEGQQRATAPLREALTKQSHYFANKYKDEKPMGINTLEVLTARFLITYNYFEDLSLNFQEILSDLGQLLIGDEKLLRFTGHSGDVRDIPSKPDRLGLWYFMLNCSLAENLYYLLHMKLWTCDTSLNISMPVWQTTTDWANVVNRHGLKPPNPNSIVIFDSYYSTRASLSTFESKNIMYLGSVKANNFKNFVKLVDPKVTQSGQWTGLYNPTSHTAFVHKWDKDERIGKKVRNLKCIRKMPQTTRTFSCHPSL
jgi:hypothetical protein